MTCSMLFMNCKSSPEISYEDGFVAVSDGLQLYYEKFGDGPENIVVPSGMYLSPIFKQLASPDRTLIIYDQRGRGKSSAVSDSMQLGWKQEIRDIESLREHFKFDTIDLIGWSYSGAIAALYAKRYPQKVNRVVQIGPMMTRKIPYWKAYIDTIQSRKVADFDEKNQELLDNFEKSGDLETYIRGYYKFFHLPLLFNKNTKESFREDFYSCQNERPDIMWHFTFPAIISSFGNWNFNGQFGDLKIPVLIIQGTYDPVPLASAKEWNASLPNSKLWIIKDVGHLPFMEKPDEVLSGIDTFLKGIWPVDSKIY